MPRKPLPPAETTVVPATLDRWDDVYRIFERVPCWCQAYRDSPGGYGRVSKEELFAHALADRQAAMRRQLAGPIPPGLLAYVEGEVAGWCATGPRQAFGRLMRSRTIPHVDDRPVWSDRKSVV